MLLLLQDNYYAIAKEKVFRWRLRVCEQQKAENLPDPLWQCLCLKWGRGICKSLLLQNFLFWNAAECRNEHPRQLIQTQPVLSIIFGLLILPTLKPLPRQHYWSLSKAQFVCCTLTGIASDKERVVCVCWGWGPIWAVSLHLSAIHSQLQAVFDLVCKDLVPLPITQTAWCIRLIDSRESACPVVNVKHHLKSTAWASASFQNSSVVFASLFGFFWSQHGLTVHTKDYVDCCPSGIWILSLS